MKQLILLLILLGANFGFAQEITFTEPNVLNDPDPSTLECDGLYGIRMDDGATGGEDATSVWCNSHTIDLNQSFEIEFCMRFGDVTAADGMTFTMQREGYTALERGGGYLGVTRSWAGAGAITPAVNIEFDIFDNGAGNGDTTADHVAISYDGVLNAPVDGPTAIPLVSNTWHAMQVSWDACEQILVVSMDDSEIARVEDDLVAHVFGGTSTGVIFGFTSATWTGNTTHDVCFKSFNAFDCCENIADPIITFLDAVPCDLSGCCVGVVVTHGTDAPVSVIYDWGDGTTSYTGYHIYEGSGEYVITVYAQYHLLDDPENCCIKTARAEVKMDCKEGDDKFEDKSFENTQTGEGLGSNVSELYPNPISKGEALVLQLDEAPAATVNFTVMSIEGKKILDFQSTGTSTIKVLLPNDLSDGMYILTSNDESIAPHKFYVKN